MPMKHIRFLSLIIGFLFSFVLLMGESGFTYRMVLMNLEEMTKEAQRIVVGVCLERKEGKKFLGPKAPPIQYREYTFQVNEVIKGGVGNTLTIRQVNLGGRKGQEGAQQFESSNPLPLPDYQPGQEVLLFLGGDSVLGFTSPVGMDQAVFDIQRVDGKSFLQSRSGNRSVFRGMSAEQKSISIPLSPSEIGLFSDREGKEISYEPFVSLIRKLAQEK